MVIIVKTNEAVGLQVTGKIGRGTEYGRRRYGWVHYGQESPVEGPRQYGYYRYGGSGYGEAWTKWGIYQRDTKTRSQRIRKGVFYIPNNPRTEAQQANRNKFIAALTAWHALTDEQKAVYNERAKGKSMTGYNVFVKQYMLS